MGTRIASPTSWASTSSCPVARIVSSTSCASFARSSLSTGRPWHALRTPLTTLARSNGSATPERLMTLSDVVSIVVKRLSHDRHSRRRRIAEPSSRDLESTTRDSSCRQNGQCMGEETSLYRSSHILVLHIVAVQPFGLLYVVS